MNLLLEDIQGHMGGLLAAHSVFAAAGLAVFLPGNPAAGNGIVLNDGIYPKIAGREEALATKGLCLIVDAPQFDTMVDQTLDGHFQYLVSCDVLVEENVLVNRTSGGTLISAEKACRNVFLACIGRSGGPSQRSKGKFEIRMSDEGFSHYGVSNGLRMMMAHLSVPQLFSSI